jgi:hypothetical protein
LDKAERYRIFCLENKTKFVNIVIKMYWRYKSDKNVTFRLRKEREDNLCNSLNISDIDQTLDDDFEYETNLAYPKRKSKDFNQAEKVVSTEIEIARQLADL